MLLLLLTINKGCSAWRNPPGASGEVQAPCPITQGPMGEPGDPGQPGYPGSKGPEGEPGQSFVRPSPGENCHCPAGPSGKKGT